MSALKLFISHSSRLDDVEHKYTCNDRNWRLLEDTCRAIRECYGDRVNVLVDRNGLIPGDKWNHQLNLWLAECHVAIILFSKRAIELRRCLFNPPEEAPHACFGNFQRTFGTLEPPPARERALYLFKCVRRLWADLGAASYFPKAMRERCAVILTGAKVHWADPDLETKH